MSTQPLRAGIIGLGIGLHHARGYTATPKSTLAALCDTDQNRLSKLAAEYHVPASACFTDYKEMLAKADLDIVSVCLPNFLHAEVTIDALKSGRHVLCEKPMTLTVSQAEEMLKVARSSDRKLAIAYNHRYRADIHWMRQTIKSGQLGKIHHVHAAWRRETGIPGRGWFGKKDLSGGGPLIDLGVHVLDLIMYLMDFPAVTTVTGSTRSVFGARGLKTWDYSPDQTGGGKFDVEDGAVGFLRFGNGVSAFLEATWAEHRQPGDDSIHVEIQGSEATVVMHVLNYRHDDTLRMYKEVEGEPVTITPVVHQPKLTGHPWLIIEFVENLSNGTPLPTDGIQGLRGVQVLQAFYESAKTGHEIQLQPITEI